MSKMPPLQCLFCSHRNLAGARYCNACAAELHLQPCTRCGAIDNRTATSCYKCGAEFVVAAVSKRAPAPAARKRAAAAPKRARAPAASTLATVPAAPVTEPAPQPPPPMPKHQVQKSVVNDGASAIERAFLSKSPARAGDAARRKLREAQDTEGQADRDLTHRNSDPEQIVVEPQPIDETVASGTVQNRQLEHSSIESHTIDETVALETVPNRELRHSAVSSQREDEPVALETVQDLEHVHPVVEPQPIDEPVALETVQGRDLTHSAFEPQPIAEPVESETAVAATGSRRARRLVLLISFLAATAASGYYYYDRSAQPPAPGRARGNLSRACPTARFRWAPLRQPWRCSLTPHLRQKTRHHHVLPVLKKLRRLHRLLRALSRKLGRTRSRCRPTALWAKLHQQVGRP